MKRVTWYRGMSASVPQASLHTDAFKLSLPFLEAPQALFGAQRHNLHARPLKKLWGSAMEVGFRHKACAVPGWRACRTWDGHLGAGCNPVPGGWHPGKGGPGLHGSGAVHPCTCPQCTLTPAMLHQEGMGTRKQSQKLPAARRLAEPK